MNQNALKLCRLIAAGLFAAAVACSSETSSLLGGAKAGEKKDDKKADAKGETVDPAAKNTPKTDGKDDHNATADEPIWVNGVYLTCDWSEALDDLRAAVGCEVPSDGRDASETGPRYTWVLKGKDGQAIPDAVTVDGPNQRFELEALRYYDATVSVRMRENGYDKTFELALREGLRGFAKNGTLDECLRDGTAVATCFEQTGVELKPVAPPQNDPQPPQPPATPSPMPQPQPVGRAVGGYYWHLGMEAKSCTETCAAYGGVTDGTIAFAGSTRDNCQQVAMAFGFSGTQGQAVATQPCDIGCYIAYGRNSWWYGGATVTQDCRGNQVMARFCSCVL